MKRWVATITDAASGELIMDSVMNGEASEAYAWRDEMIAGLAAQGRSAEGRVMPEGLLFESRPTAWWVRETTGELLPLSSSSLKDPLPHVAVRVFDGEVGASVVLERGLERSALAMKVVSVIVPKHLRSMNRITDAAVKACRAEIEDELARLVSRGEIRATSNPEWSEGRVWS